MKKRFIKKKIHENECSTIERERGRGRGRRSGAGGFQGRKRVKQTTHKKTFFFFSPSRFTKTLFFSSSRLSFLSIAREEPWTRIYAWRCSPASWAPERGKVSEVERTSRRRDECICSSVRPASRLAREREREREREGAVSQTLMPSFCAPCFPFLPFVFDPAPRVCGFSSMSPACRTGWLQGKKKSR